MADSADVPTPVEPPSTPRQKLRFIGPGIVVAASGVGAGDFIMAALAGAGFGWSLLWAIVAGAGIKLVLSEGIGRWFLVTGQSFLRGWHSLGSWATVYFGLYLVFFAIIYGAAEPAISALVLTAMFPGTSFAMWAILTALAGFLLVRFGRYALVEKAMTVFIGIMFVTVVGSAAIILANLGDVPYGLAPSIPDGSFSRILAIIGGVGGTISLTCYSYWIAAKGWAGKKWLGTMRVDITTAYTLTGIFAVAVLIIAAELLFGTGVTISGNQGLVELADAYGQRFGNTARWLLLIGVWSAVFTSIIGPWHGCSYLFADFVRIVRHRKADLDGVAPASDKDTAFRGYLALMTFPPMLLLLFDAPIMMVLIYGISGAIFMPLLSVGLLVLLNSRRLSPEHRNGVVSNVLLCSIVVLFVYLGATELMETLST
ncbi:Nramp family divalent metal transporter [Saccharopolyspora cebuensis]|uniref:Nramp family divalent metal transporter n=1 Tax=Saccharopolyspora cebuensis TaxID=418759 RepID=A0ABV4CL24_9PSEU